MKTSGLFRRLCFKFNILAFLIAVLLLVNPLSAIAQTRCSPFSHPRIKIKEGTSANWSGYVAESSIASPANGFVNGVAGSWTIPTLILNASQNTYLAAWVGIDGYSDGTVEQIGTEQDCVNGVQQNYAWVEFYPYPSQMITRFTVRNGDIINASVLYRGSNYFALSIKDLTTGQLYSKTYQTNAQRQSAEWVVEAPSSLIGGVLPLANFETVRFSHAQFVDSTGVSHAIDDEGKGTYDAITMNNPNGESAWPSVLVDSMQPGMASSFNVTYSPSNLLPAQHDVAITNITLFKTIVGQGYSANVNVTTMNKGNYTESFNVTLYANATLLTGNHIVIGTQTVKGLLAGKSLILTYVWNTNGVPKGNYTISALAAVVQGETNTSNNSFTDGNIQVAKLGDVNGDGKNNVLDLIAVATSLGTFPGDARWNPNADINNDGIVNLSDLILVAEYLES